MQILRSCRCNLRSPSTDRRSDHGPCWWSVVHHCNPSQPAQKIWLSVDPRPDLRSVQVLSIQITLRSVPDLQFSRISWSRVRVLGVARGVTTYHDKATQTETEEEDTIEKILKAITTLCTKVDSMDNEIQKLKTNEDNLESKASQQHDYKNAELRQAEDGKKSELKGDDGKLLKTHNVCLNTAAAPAEILYEEIKPPIQVIKIGSTKDMIIPEDIGQ
ncbi:hypothetical protein MTR67_022130 [Solanum verrucosum]|uniref:Uncharacterized protein n=1 Tax=Solanum verrucosum TaxID=315347 RepID=A0AAF0QU34_SOLVR|nr:hypothetical protein MTR67_022130 [Solanum verrucosum]